MAAYFNLQTYLNIAQMYPAILTGSDVLGSLITLNPLGLINLVINLTFGELLNRYLKTFSRWLGPKFKLFMRPDPPSTGCGTLPICHMKKEHVLDTVHGWGMPSGHSQIATIAAVFWIMYLLDTRSSTLLEGVKGASALRYTSIGVMTIITMAVMYSRIFIGCHNGAQIAVGGIIGTILAAGSYYLCKYLFKKIFPDYYNATFSDTLTTEEALFVVGAGIALSAFFFFVKN